MSKSSSFSPPTLRQALMARLINGSLVKRDCPNILARAGNAETIDKSSLMALAASVTMYSSSSFKKEAISL